MQHEIRQLGATEILGRAWNLLKDNPTLILGIMAALMLPVTLAGGLAQYFLIPDVSGLVGRLASGAEVDPELMAELAARFAAFLSVMALLGIITAVVVMPVTNAAVMFAVSRKYLGKDVSVGVALAFALGRLPALLWTGIVKGLFVSIGFVCLVIPGFVLLFRYMLADHAVVLEGVSGRAALRRSSALTQGNFMKVVVLAALMVLIAAVAGVVASIVPGKLASVFAESLIQSAVWGLFSTAWVLLYYSARRQHEGFDLAGLAKQLGVGVREVGAPTGSAH